MLNILNKVRILCIKVLNFIAGEEIFFADYSNMRAQLRNVASQIIGLGNGEINFVLFEESTYSVVYGTDLFVPIEGDGYSYLVISPEAPELLFYADEFLVIYEVASDISAKYQYRLRDALENWLADYQRKTHAPI